MKRMFLLVVALHVALVSPGMAAAQSKPVKRVSARPESAPDPVVISDAFALATQNERWSLDEPSPAATVRFAGKAVTLDERKVNSSVSANGERQILFPVSWYEPY